MIEQSMCLHMTSIYFITGVGKNTDLDPCQNRRIQNKKKKSTMGVIRVHFNFRRFTAGRLGTPLC